MDRRPYFPTPANIRTSAGVNINVSKLRGGAKREAWRKIQKRAPDLADLLRSDPNIQLLREHFGAQLLVPKDLIDE